MTSTRTYLDYNASAPLRAEARAAMIAALEAGGNPSSVHAEGRKARVIVDLAREQVAALVGAKPSEVVFTSGATEANASVFAQRWDTMFVPGIEHASVLAPAAANGGRVIDIAAHGNGVAAVEEIAERVLRGGGFGRAMVALQLANNETGVIQPVAETAAFARAHDIFLHCDAVQAAGRIAIGMTELGVDTLSLSSHKIGGPKGAGALIIRDGVSLPVLMAGGGQERRRRGGTENVAAIAGFGVAAELAARDVARAAQIKVLRDVLETAILELTPEAIILGAEAPRLANTSCIAWPGKLAETLVIRLDLAGIAVSAGSACSSGKVGQSHVLAAIGLMPEIAGSAIRISLGPETTARDCNAFLDAWRAIRGPREALPQKFTAAGSGGPLHVSSGVH
jgi:cysteine desulfurase